jgi:uncharacterized BrkB/YihY/UPF0761 family membrane protein
MASPSAFAAMYFIAVHRILMNKKKQRKRPIFSSGTVMIILFLGVCILLRV